MPSELLTPAKVWINKIDAAKKLKKQWSEKYKTELLEQYYEGFQWGGDTSDNPYVINLIYATIETKMPILIFDNPKFTITPKPKSIFEDPESSFQIALNLEDALNQWAGDDENVFQEEMEGALLDNWFRFGVVELGYSANWMENPKANKPVLKSDFTTLNVDKNNTLKNPEVLPADEGVYIRHIPASNFLVSSENAKYLSKADWCGYFELIRLRDLLSNKDFDLDGIQYAGYHSEEHASVVNEPVVGESDSEERRLEKTGDYVKVWKIWSRRDRKKYYIIEEHNKIIYTGRYNIFPFVDIRFRKPLKGFYPLPVIYNWISQQNELNEAREANRMHRRRFKRLYTMVEGGADFDEVAKIINGPDGGIVTTKRPDVIGAIPNADLGASQTASMIVTKDDFNIISGTTAEMRGQNDRETATAANISNQRAMVRESREKIVVANFFRRVAKKLLRIMQKEFVNPITVETKPQEEFLGNVESKRGAREINPLTDLGTPEFEYSVDISIDTTSPVANEEEKRNFLEFLALLNTYPQFSLSPVLVRELAFRTGYRNERVIQEFQKMAQLALMGMLTQGVNNLKQQGIDISGLAQNMVASATPPDQEEIRQQIEPTQVLQ